jgi:3',5'-cyclic AMP phosphodiesterase CpdA
MRIGQDVEGGLVDFVLHTGDVVHPTGTYRNLQAKFFDIYAPWLHRVPVFPTLGNHDELAAHAAPYLDVFALPEGGDNALFPDHRERYYSFDVGPAHIVAMNTHGAFEGAERGQQLAWLEADLASTTQPWRVVFLHRPLWSSSRHGSDAALQASLAPLFEVHAVDLVLCGHDHDYERTFPMAGATPVAVAQDPDFVDPLAPVYVVTGGGGKDLYPAGVSAFTAASESSFHAVSVVIDDDTLTLEAVRVDGTAIDRMTIRKTP